jgi:hypothetical protein
VNIRLIRGKIITTVHIETMGRPPGCKLIRLSADIDNGIIRSLSVRGDFFASPEEAFETVERRMTEIALSDFSSAFDAFCREEGVECFGINGEAIETLFKTAVEEHG